METNNTNNEQDNIKSEPSYGWYLLSCPVKREESIAKKIASEIAERYEGIMGPVIAPSLTSTETVDGKIKTRIKYLRGFVLLRVLLSTNSYGKPVPDKNLFTLLRSLSGVNIMYDKPMTQAEVDKMIEKSTKENIADEQRQMNSTESITIIEGPFKGMLGNIVRRSVGDEFDIIALVVMFNREIEIPLTLSEVIINK